MIRSDDVRDVADASEATEGPLKNDVVSGSDDSKTLFSIWFVKSQPGPSPDPFVGVHPVEMTTIGAVEALAFAYIGLLCLLVFFSFVIILMFCF